MKPLDSKNAIDEERPKLPAAAHAVASSEDLLREIFPRLRPKQLARFKLVSKRWNSLISDPDLLRNRTTQPAVGLLRSTYTTDPPFSIIPFDKSDDPKPLRFPNNRQPFSSITIVHACNGLVLCSGKDTEWPMLTKRYFVLNPTTMQYATLPDPTTVDKSMNVRGMCLAFDPSTSPHYKVVCVSGIWGPHSRICMYKQFEVYSSETGSWRIRTNMETFIGNLDIGKGVYWNGAVHWIAIYGSLGSIYFNPDDDEGMHRLFPTPPTSCYSAKSHYYNYADYFGESCGHLHYFVYSRLSCEATLYEMRRDYSEWFIKCRSTVDLNRTHFRELDIQAVVWGKKDEDRFFIFNSLFERIVTRYNIVSGTFTTLHYLPYQRSSGVPLYSESMSLV